MLGHNMRNFILQKDDVCRFEKSAIRHVSMLAPAGMIEIRFASLSDIESGHIQPSRAFVPVGTVEFCKAWIRACGIHEPDPIDYPECLRSYLGRSVVLCANYDRAPVGHWVKPVQTKAWEAHIKSASRALTPSASGIDFDAPVWASDPLVLLGEWRAYVSHGLLHGMGRYDDSNDEVDEYTHPAFTETLPEMIVAFEASGQAPAAYALDVALTQDHRLVLIEVTDAWALGFYRGSCKPLAYAHMLAARWHQIASSSAPEGIEEQPQLHQRNPS